MDLLVRGGTVATAGEVRRADVAVDGGRVVAVAPEVREDADRVIDASGLYVLPGFIDPHTHMELPVAGTVSSDDFFTGTRAAAAGGVTTIIDFCSQLPGESFEEVVAVWKARAAKSVIDYGFHMIVPQLEAWQIAQIPDLVAEGISTVKCMMAYKRGPQGSDDANLMRVIYAARDAGALPMVHAENGDAIDVNIDRLLAAGHTAPRFHPISRPPLTEAEAVNRAASLAALAGCPMYIVHLSSAEALEALEIARSRGWEVYAETCPQYLTLDERCYESPGFEAAKYVCSPPLRPPDSPPRLWEGLRTGALQLVASDHCPFYFRGQKDMGRDNFAAIPNGISTIEPMYPLLWNGGVRTHVFDVSTFVRLSSTNAAKLFGLYPRKGEIAVGSDADLVVFDPAAERRLTSSTLHSRVDYTPYEGLSVTGWPAWTISRGEVVAADGEPAGERGRGRFLRRKPWTGNPLGEGRWTA